MADRDDIFKKFKVDGELVDGNIADRIVDMTIVRSRQGSASLEVVAHDPDRLILTSGLLRKDRPAVPTPMQQRIDDFDRAAWARFGRSLVTFDGWAVRLAGVQPSYVADGWTMGLTFEDEIATMMRRGTKFIESTRNMVTRAQFIHQLLSIVSRQGEDDATFKRFFSPESALQQPVAKDVQAREERQKGISGRARITIKGREPDSTQRRHLEAALAVADEEKAGELATLAMLCAGTGESTWTNVVNSLGFGGVFQGAVATTIHPSNWFANMGPFERTREQAKSFLLGGRGYQQGGAIKLAADNPDMQPGEIATRVEVSGKPGSFYNQWLKEAEKILDAWGGVYRTETVTRKFQFRAGGKRDGEQHNYWDDAGALADEVRWRLFADLNILYYVSDEWLFARRPAFTISDRELDNGLVEFTAQADIGVPVAECQVSTRTERWGAPPGATVELQDLGPFDGRWLIDESRTNLFTGHVDVKLQRPAPKLKEPAPKSRTKRLTEAPTLRGSARRRIVEVAERAYKQRGRYRYTQQFGTTGGSRPMNGLFSKENPNYQDCSTFVTMVYKAAGMPDPNGRGYDGQGYTGTLAANGTRTDDPQPGDMAFYGSGPPFVHVNLYLGNGQHMNMGPSAGLSKGTRDNFGDFYGWYTFELDEE